ncbi:unnamed protein product [Lampetra planeri]
MIPCLTAALRGDSIKAVTPQQPTHQATPQPPPPKLPSGESCKNLNSLHIMALEQLQELADKLKRQLKDIDQNENIQKAILVSKVYEDIIKALKETEVAANQAL